MALRQRMKRLIPGVACGAKRTNICLYWPKAGTHPDFAITFAWIGRWSHRGEIGLPRNIGRTGAYWHWPLGLGFIDWWGQKPNMRALRQRTRDRIDRFDVPRGAE